MSKAFSAEEPISDKQVIADGEALRKKLRHLQVVRDSAVDDPVDTNEGWVYEPPDVIGAQRIRDEYRREMPNLSEAELECLRRPVPAPSLTGHSTLV